MNPMRITKLGHSCLLLEDGTTSILVDPGKYSFGEGAPRAPESFEGLNAILITHEHGDHAAPDAIKIILGKNKVPVYGNSGVKAALDKAGIEVELLEDKVIKIGGMQVEALSAKHEPLLKEIPQNTAYFVNNTLLITGDSLSKELHKIKPRILALPVAGPWMNMMQAAEFAKDLAPEIALPVHDAVMRQGFMEGMYPLWEKYLAPLGIRFVIAEPGKTMQF
jgi:L-ascorbate metabolism protein UlaG (beta-lactamase superfamily)